MVCATVGFALDAVEFRCGFGDAVGLFVVNGGRLVVLLNDGR